MNRQEYEFCEPKHWAKKISDEQLISYLHETEFSKEQTDEGRDYCFVLDKVIYTSDEENAEYKLMAYSLNQPDNLKAASVYEHILEEGGQYLIHRISILRDGVLIDKTPDVSIKVLDEENESNGGVLQSLKKVNITIKDLRLYDILILEDTLTKHFTEKDFLRKAFYRSIVVSPDTYWAYGLYSFELINDRTQPLTYKKHFYRDENGNLLPDETGEIPQGERFKFSHNDYINDLDVQREVYPFIDFVTKASWEELSNFITPYYEQVVTEHPLSSYAPEFAKQLDEIEDKDQQIAFAIEYVQNHIRYIYNEMEMHGHIPQSPDITFTNKQGDCKAKCVLLKTFFDYLNISSEIILVNFQADHYLRVYQPSLLAFNHVILKVHYNDKEYFVDPTLLDEYGGLENGSIVSFCYYLPIRQGASLQQRPAVSRTNYGIEEEININVVNNKGKITIKSKYRNNRANAMRRYFRNANKREIIDSWNNFIFYSMNFHNDRKEEDIRNVFINPKIEIISDDKLNNEFITEYTAEVDNAYFTDKNNGRRFLMFFDHNINKNVGDFNHKDILYWHNFDREKYAIHLNTDESIDTKEKYTVQELSINHKYLSHTIKKDIRKNGGSAYIDYNPISNVEIPHDEIEELKKQYREISDSNFGLGIDIIEKGFFNKLKFTINKILK